MQGKSLWEYAETTCDGKNKMQELMGKSKTYAYYEFTANNVLGEDGNRC